MNSRSMAKAMKRMGIQQTELDAKEVIIRLEDKELVFVNPQVAKVNMMGQETFQVIGTPQERAISSEPEISEEDVQTVVDQTGAEKEAALAAVKKHKGDIAAAILDLKGEE
jgi:nascent polypeptide-associated complex subunit alpha